MAIPVGIKGFFEKHKANTTGHRKAMHGQIAAVLRISGAVQAHVLELQAQLSEAELEEGDQAINPKLAYMHTRLGGAERAAATFRAAARDLAKVLVEVEQGLDADSLAVQHHFSERGKPKGEAVAIADPTA